MHRHSTVDDRCLPDRAARGHLRGLDRISGGSRPRGTCPPHAAYRPAGVRDLRQDERRQRPGAPAAPGGRLAADTSRTPAPPQRAISLRRSSAALGAAVAALSSLGRVVRRRNRIRSLAGSDRARAGCTPLYRARMGAGGAGRGRATPSPRDWMGADDANVDITYGRKSLAYGPDEVGSHPVSNSPVRRGRHGRKRLGVDANRSARERVRQRGGSWYQDALTTRSYNREFVEPTFRSSLIGLRMCASVADQ